MPKKTLPFSLETLEHIAEKYGTPTFVTSEKILHERMQQMIEAFPMKKKIFYAIKANYNPAIVKSLKDAGLDGIDTVSPFEVRLALELGFSPENIIFTGSNPSDEEMRYVTEQGVLVNAGSLSEIERFGKMFPGEKIAVRINPSVGKGLFDGVVTGGEKSKFGVHYPDFEKAKEIAKKYDLQICGIHTHIGSGFYTPKEFLDAVKMVLSEAKNFSDLEFVDFGGGFGIPYKPEEEHIDLKEFGRLVKSELDAFNAQNGKEIEMRIEPGRFLPCESTILLSQVTTIKNTNDRKFIGLNTGFHHLVRPAMYGSYHHIVNASNLNGEIEVADIVGNLCESTDIFARQREIAKTKEGDLVAILDAGAYGLAQGTNYNLRPFACEVMVKEDGELVETRTRQSFEDVMKNFIY
jgi:diaminopimelate decarboxylase